MDGAVVIDRDGVEVLALEQEMDILNTTQGMAGSLLIGGWQKRKWAVALDPVMRCIT